MPGAGRAVELGLHLPPSAPVASSHTGATTFDIHLTDHAYWRNIPAAVWDYKLGGYQVLKKWLSPRASRPRRFPQVQHFGRRPAGSRLY